MVKRWIERILATVIDRRIAVREREVLVRINSAVDRAS